MARQNQERHKEKDHRKTRLDTPGPKTRSRTPAADDPGFWGRRGWPSAALNGKDGLEQTPVRDREEKSTVVGQEESLTLKQALREMFSFHPTHDEFSAKSIVISAVIASALLAGAFYFAKMIVDIMAKE